MDYIDPLKGEMKNPVCLDPACLDPNDRGKTLSHQDPYVPSKGTFKGEMFTDGVFRASYTESC